MIKQLKKEFGTQGAYSFPFRDAIFLKQTCVLGSKQDVKKLSSLREFWQIYLKVSQEVHDNSLSIFRVQVYV